MLFIFFLQPILLESRIIMHNCDFSNENFDIYTSEINDYHIFCNPQKIQIINLSKTNQPCSISIYGNSKVFITCDKNAKNNISLSIYDTPEITFENYCQISNMHIYDYPKLNLFNNSDLLVDTVYLYNNRNNYSYKFPFHQKRIIYNENENTNKKIFKEIEQTDNLIDECNDSILKGTLNDNYITIKCGNSFEYTFLYSNINDHIVKLKHQNVFLENQISLKKNTNINLEKILSSLNFDGKRNITLEKFDIKDFFDSFYKMNSDDYIWINSQDYRRPYCYWDEEYDQDYLFETGLRKVCAGSKAYYYCCDSEKGPRNIVIISTTGSIIIIVAIIFVSLALIISLYIITWVRFSRLKQVYPGDDSSSND